MCGTIREHHRYKACYIPSQGVQVGCSSPFFLANMSSYVVIYIGLPVSLWCMARGTPDLRLPSQSHSVTAVWPIPNCTACHWPQRHTGTSSLFKATKRWCPARTRTRYPQVWCPTDSDTMPGLHDTSQINAKKTWELGIFPCLVNVQFCSCCNGYLSASISEC